MVGINWKRKERPEPKPLPTRSADGSGWGVHCAKCGSHRMVSRQQIMSGSWMVCPSCEVPTETGRKDESR
jgi:hypothetical protein